MKDVLPYGRHWIDGKDVAAVARVLRGGWLTQGPAVAEFESRMARFCGAAHAVAFSSGTAALHAAAAAAGLGPGDEAVTSPLSFAASANCVVFQGATPRFVDVEPGGYLLDPQGLEKIWNRRIKAVIAVDFAGHPADLDAIRAFCRRRGAVVIEDASHSLGALYKGRRVGTLADMTTLSFHPVKTMTTGEGGMVLTHKKDWADGLRRFREHGIRRTATAGAPWFYEMAELGYNYRLPDLNCALGISQLAKLPAFLRRRRALARRYDAAFKNLRHLKPLAEKPWGRSAYHLYAVQIDFAALKKTRGQVMAELRAAGVGSQVHYIPIHLHPFYRRAYGHRSGNFPQAEAFYAKALSLPLFPRMTDADAARVIRAVAKAVA